MLTVLQLNGFTPNIRTDCQSLLTTALAGTTRATSGSKVLARIWRDIADILDEDISVLVRDGKLVWQPGHCSRASVGQAKLSNGARVSPADWRANRLVDRLAKNAAAFHVLTKSAANLINSTAKFAQHSLAQLANVTHAANNFKTTVVDENGVATTKVMRDSTSRPRVYGSAKDKKRQRKPQPPARDLASVKPWQPEPVLDERARRAKVRRTAAHARTAAHTERFNSSVTRLASTLTEAAGHEDNGAKANVADAPATAEAQCKELTPDIPRTPDVPKVSSTPPMPPTPTHQVRTEPSTKRARVEQPTERTDASKSSAAYREIRFAPSIVRAKLPMRQPPTAHAKHANPDTEQLSLSISHVKSISRVGNDATCSTSTRSDRSVQESNVVTHGTESSAAHETRMGQVEERGQGECIGGNRTPTRKHFNWPHFPS